MFVRSCLIVFTILLVSCSGSKKLSSSVSIFKGEVHLCKQVDDNFKFHVQVDSLNNVEIRIYTSTALKVADVVLQNDTSYVKSAFNDDLKSSIEFYLAKYNKRICLNQFFIDLFSQHVFDKASSCYNISKTDDRDRKAIYHIFDLNQERLLTLENVIEKKSAKLAKYNLFNESFCIELTFKKP